MPSVLIILFDGVQSLDVTGPLEVLHGASSYSIRTASLGGHPVRTSSGLTLTPDQDLAGTRPPDLLIVPGGQGTRRRDPELIDWLRKTAPATARLASVCTGAFPDLSVESLASRASLSPRHFARAFAAETGVTPGQYVDRVRVEAARRHLEDTAQGVEEISRACGYGTPEAMRRAFIRSVGVSPAEYRRRFHP